MSEAMKNLQEKCGVSADGAFGPNTARAIAKFYDLTPERGAHLMGQAAHESGGFRLTEENLNYSVASMMRVWPSRFPTEESAQPYARNPQALADKVYGDRMGNDGEGYKWRGRGFLQLTGRDNYEAFASDMSLPEVIDDPDCVEDDYAFETALWYFNKNKLFDIADEGVNDDTIKRITRRVNGGYHGLDDRTEQTQKIYRWLTS
jgi:putative chitinase